MMMPAMVNSVRGRVAHHGFTNMARGVSMMLASMMLGIVGSIICGKRSYVI